VVVRVVTLEVQDLGFQEAEAAEHLLAHLLQQGRQLLEEVLLQHLP
jgi:hypothetical protein